jgi:hypothetical protein
MFPGKAENSVYVDENASRKHTRDDRSVRNTTRQLDVWRGTGYALCVRNVIL